MNVRHIFVIVIACGCITTSVGSRVKKQLRNDDYIAASDMPTMRTQQGFNYVLKNYPYVVAFAYSLHHAENAAHSQVGEVYTTIEKYIQDDPRRYANARVKFIGINFEMGDLKELMQRYDLSDESGYLLFFKNRKLIATHVVAHKFSWTDLDTFMDAIHLEDYVDEQLAEKAREEKRMNDKKRYYRYYDDYYYGGMYGGCGYGYAGYGCGYGGFGYGPYWGCGGGCGGYGNCGCASFGVSFSV